MQGSGAVLAGLGVGADLPRIDPQDYQRIIAHPASAVGKAAMTTVPFRFEGLTLTVASIERSVAFYHGLLGLAVAVNAAPAFALVKAGGGNIGLLALAEAELYIELLAKGVVFRQPPHDEPWERSMTACDPDGYAVEFAQGRRGGNRTDGKG
jgi:hypothetical protein